MARLKKMIYPAENNELIYVPKSIVDGISKKAIITNQFVVGGTGGKLVIEYMDKKGSGRGVIELYDMGKDEPKKKNNKGEI